MAGRDRAEAATTATPPCCAADWATAGHMRAELVVDALRVAVAARRPPDGTIHHLDHGGRYIGPTFGQVAHDVNW